jgi:hypothetical protein
MATKHNQNDKTVGLTGEFPRSEPVLQREASGVDAGPVLVWDLCDEANELIPPPPTDRIWLVPLKNQFDNPETQGER